MHDLIGQVLPPGISQDIKDGACLTCLANGTVSFPLDPRHHAERSGHVPELADLPKTCAALDITTERWEAEAELAAGQIFRPVRTPPTARGRQPNFPPVGTTEKGHHV